MTNSPSGPLTGVRILDVSQVVAGPLATQMLAEQGADVIKIEPLHGDILRIGVEKGFPPLYANSNRGKRSVAVDANHAAGREIILDLARDIDVFVENFRPGVSERMGLGEAAIRAMSPDVIYVSINGFGSSGPYSSRACLDPVIQGLTGLVTGQISEDLPFPDLVRTLVADKTTAYTAAQSITAALFARERGSGGQHLEIPMLDATLAWFWVDGMTDFTFVDATDRARRASDTYRLTDTSDGQIIYYVATTEQLLGIWRALDRPDMAADERYNSIVGAVSDPANLYAIGAAIAEGIAKFTSADIIERLAAESVPVGPILDRADVAADPQIVHNEALTEWDHPVMGTLRQPPPATRFSKTPTEMSQVIEELGESTATLLRELGRSDADLEILRTAGTIA